MKEIWKVIKEFPNYSVSNKGRVKNNKTKHFLKQWSPVNSALLYVTFSNWPACYHRGVHVLVAKYFKKMKKKDNSALHLNYVQFDNREPNVDGCTKGQAIVRTRKHNRLKKGKIKGIYKWAIGKNKFRAVLSLEDGKMGTQTIGYFKTKKEAILAYHAAYLEKFGVKPFKLRNHV